METKQVRSLQKVYSIQQDSFGYLWFGSNNGLFYYNGDSFRHYHSNNRQDYIPFNNVYATLGRQADELILTNSSEIAIFNYLNYSFDSLIFEKPAGLDEYKILPVVIDGKGVLWAMARINENDYSYVFYLFNSTDFEKLNFIKKFQVDHFSPLGNSKNGVLLPLNNSSMAFSAVLEEKANNLEGLN